MCSQFYLLSRTEYSHLHKMSLMNNSDSGTCDLLEQAIRELNELSNCNKTQQEPILIENETQDIEIIEIFPP